jgi:RNA polymerase subunit RPABC4/transcription elongation factor Spt4
MPDSRNVPTINMHVYECNSCVGAFATEDHEDLDHSEIKCPFCEGPDVSDAGYGVVVIIKLPDIEEDEQMNV